MGDMTTGPSQSGAGQTDAPDNLDDAAELMRVMGHPIRLSLIQAIANNELSVGEIENATGVTQPTLSQQLAVLRKADMVETRRQAKQIFYTLNPLRLETITCFMCHLAGQMGLGPAAMMADNRAVPAATKAAAAAPPPANAQSIAKRGHVRPR